MLEAPPNRQILQPPTAPAAPLVCAIVVSFNTRDMTLRCLRTLQRELAHLHAEIWVVDNASTDGSAAAIAEALPDVRLIRNERNAGFGAANNLAMARSRGEFLLLLNSDAFVKPGAVEALLDVMRADPRVGVAGPRLLNSDSSPQPCCFAFPSPGHAWVENLFPGGWGGGWTVERESAPPWIVGAAMLVRREVFLRVGGFDERFFLYAEESDWQRRIRSAGWQVRVTPAAEVEHLGRASSEGRAPAAEEQFFHSLDLYQLKHHGWLGLVSFRLAMVFGCSLRAALWLALGLARRARRPLAIARARRHAWLVVRQASRWPGRGQPFCCND